MTATLLAGGYGYSYVIDRTEDRISRDGAIGWHLLTWPADGDDPGMGELWKACTVRRRGLLESFIVRAAAAT